MNKRKKTEILLLIISLLLLAASGFFLRKYYPLLPDTVPVHFGANGEPDRWGSKETFLGVYVLQIVLNAVMCTTQILMVREKLKGSTARDSGSFLESSSPILYNGGLLAGLVNVYMNVIFGWIFIASVLFGKMGKFFLVMILCGMAGIFLFCFLWRGKPK